VNISRRKLLSLTASAVTSSAVSYTALAQSYPSRPVRLIVTFPPGGALDVVTRITGQRLSERLGQAFIVENRPGAGGALGIEAVANARPDGYTLLMLSSANTMAATLYSKNNTDVLRDIVLIGGIVRVPNIMEVNPSVPANSVREFIDYAKANPGRVNMASAGLGTTGHMNGELFKMMTGVDMLHVPYRGGGPAISDLIGGQVQVLFDPMSSSIEHVRSGKIRALAVTSAARSDALPSIPTVSETVPAYETSFWVGVGGPKGTPPDIIERMNQEINAALADPDFKAQLNGMDGAAIPGRPGDFAKIVFDETEKWAKVTKFTGMKLVARVTRTEGTVSSA
jgi:tripartite-type tricarboxylate transporter receptor subunit TctC